MLEEVRSALGRRRLRVGPARRRLRCIPALECLPDDHEAVIVRPNERPVGRDDASTDVARVGAYGFEQSSFDEPFRSYAAHEFAKKPAPPPVA